MNTLRKATPLAASLAVYIAAIVAANVMTSHMGLVGVGFGLLVPAGTFAAGFALLARDFVHRNGGVRWVLVGIAVGAALSWYFATPQLAMASAVAFAGAELVDMTVFATLIDSVGFVTSALVSNIVSAPLDTVLFLWLAGFPLTWEAIAGQFIGKVVWATVVPLVLYVGASRVVSREPVRG